MTDKNLCSLCPRNCNVDRKTKTGFCGAKENITLAKVMLHKWEEPCICYKNGSGALFFSGCQLKCAFCQNYEISSQIKGKNITKNELCDLFFYLEEKGACNINLVSPTPYLKEIIPALEKAKGMGLDIPILLNCGGYESEEVIKTLSGLIDIYLPDFKFWDSNLSFHLAGAKDYREVCLSALKEMYRQTGSPLWNGDHLEKGLMIRHLILPGKTDDSIKILEELSLLFAKDQIILSLLRQYTPFYKAKEMEGLNRKLTTLEYQKVLSFAEKLDFTYLYTQRKESAAEDYIPDFTVFS